MDGAGDDRPSVLALCGEVGGKVVPYLDATFDLAVDALAVHYGDHRVAALAELNRVLPRRRPRALHSTSDADWLRNGGSYFDALIETDMWSGRDGEHEVRF
jgi:hypothetical protein